MASAVMWWSSFMLFSQWECDILIERFNQVFFHTHKEAMRVYGHVLTLPF